MDLCVFRWCYSNLFHDFVTRHFGKHKDFEIVGQGIVYSFSSRVPLPHSFRLVSQHFQTCQIWATQIAKKSAFFGHPSRIHLSFWWGLSGLSQSALGSILFGMSGGGR